MNVDRSWLRKVALACVAGLGLFSIVACGGDDTDGGNGSGSRPDSSPAGTTQIIPASGEGDDEGDGGDGGNPDSAPPATMQITPSTAAVRSFSRAQVVEMPEDYTFDAIIEDEDQTLVYGLNLDAGVAFGADVVAEGGDERAMVRFYGQYGEEIPTFELEDGGVGFEATRSGPYFMAVRAAPGNGGAQIRSSDTTQGILKSYKVAKVTVRLFGKTGPQAAKALKKMIAVLFSKKPNKLDEMKKIANEHGLEIVAASQDVFAVLSQMWRPDAMARDFVLRCPLTEEEQRPVLVGETCVLLVYVENVGTASFDYLDSVVEDLAYDRSLFSTPPPVTFYRSIDQDISFDDEWVAESEFPEWQRALSSTASDIQDIASDLRSAMTLAYPWLDLIPNSITSLDLAFPKFETVTLKEAGTFYYGACVKVLPLERGSGNPIVFPDITGNNCSEGVMLEVEDVPIVSIADAGSVVEGNPLDFTVSLRKQSGRTVTVDWELSPSSQATSADFSGLTIGTLALGPVTSGTLTFSPGETSRTITLMTLDDHKPEGEETAIISLSIPVADPNAEPPVPPVTPVLFGSATASGVIGDAPLDHALHEAAEFNEVGTIRALVAAGVDVNAYGRPYSLYWGRTPLVVAIRNNSTSAIQTLVAAGADVNLRERYNSFDEYTPLHLAATRGNTSAIQVLVAAGADVNANSYDGQTPLHQAAANDRSSAVQALVAAGADVNAKDSDGETPLHRAVIGDRSSTVQALVAAGADVNAKDSSGETPLHWAAVLASENVIRQLINAGADLSAREVLGHTPCFWPGPIEEYCGG